MCVPCLQPPPDKTPTKNTPKGSTRAPTPKSKPKPTPKPTRGKKDVASDSDDASTNDDDDADAKSNADSSGDDSDQVTPFALSDPDGLWNWEERQRKEKKHNKICEDGDYDVHVCDCVSSDDEYHGGAGIGFGEGPWFCMHHRTGSCVVCEGYTSWLADSDMSADEEGEMVNTVLGTSDSCDLWGGFRSMVASETKEGGREGGWMGMVWLDDMAFLDTKRRTDTANRLSRFAEGPTNRRVPLDLGGWQGVTRYPSMWFEGDGIPKGFWIGDTGVNSLPPELLGRKGIARACDADAGTALWVLCMGSAADNRQKQSDLHPFFSSPLVEPRLLCSIVEFLCPNRAPLARAVAYCREHALAAIHADRKSIDPWWQLREVEKDVYLTYIYNMCVYVFVSCLFFCLSTLRKRTYMTRIHVLLYVM
jgi:hypothetical protein